MTKTKREPERCKECGHIIENRVLNLNRTLVTALYRVWRWCEERDQFEFERKEVSHLFTGETMVATFGDLQYFGGILYRPPHNKSRGSWAINKERARIFFANEHPMYTRIVIDRVSNKVIDRSEPRKLRDVPKLTEFLDEEYKFVPEYVPRSEMLKQGEEMKEVFDKLP